MMVNPIATAGVYLAFSVPASGLLWMITRRPIVSAAAGSLGAMIVTSLLRWHLPCHYWTHANDFIIEPFWDLHLLSEPLEAILFLCFHVGLPVTIIQIVDRVFRRTIPAHSCQCCGYDLTGNISGVCSECGTPIEVQKA